MMKNIFKITTLVLLSLSAVSCYEDFLDDYDFSAVYFASQKPLRTVISGRDMSIQVGVAISGKREVDPKDWAEYEIDFLEMVGSGLEILPDEYYTLSDASMMKIAKSNLPIASVTVNFTDAFYADPLCTKTYYGIPFKVVNSSCDSILAGKESTVVAIKYASTYSGTYCVSGTIQTLDARGQSVSSLKYGDTEKSSTYTRTTTTLSPEKIVVAGLGNTFPAKAGEDIQLTFGEDGTLTVETAEGGLTLTDATGSFIEGDRLTINLSYKYEKEGVKYAVTETLVRRQDPAADLYYEEW